MTSNDAIERLEAVSQPRDRILDLGTKRGDCLEGCAGTVVGIDIDGSQFRPRESPTAFALADGRQLPFDSDSFDYLYCGAVLEHVDGADEVIAEAARVLRPDGTAFFGFPNRWSLFQPHDMVPRWWSVLPRPVGDRLAPHVLDEESQRYHEVGLHPQSPVSARRAMRTHFRDVENIMSLSGESVSDRASVQRLFQAADILADRPPAEWPFELLWPHASYRCDAPGPATA